MNSLPDKPSELIRHALADLALCKDDPNYRIDMGKWHKPEYGVCQVCLAGAVMAKSLNASRAAELCPRDFMENRRKLLALDEFCSGLIDLAMGTLGHSLSDAQYAVLYRDITRYGRDPVAFIDDMRDLAFDLEQAGY